MLVVVYSLNCTKAFLIICSCCSISDGVCCSYGNGYYEVKYQNQGIASGEAFGSTASHTFGSIEPITPPPTTSPSKPPTKSPVTPTCEYIDIYPLSSYLLLHTNSSIALFAHHFFCSNIDTQLHQPRTLRRRQASHRPSSRLFR